MAMLRRITLVIDHPTADYRRLIIAIHGSNIGHSHRRPSVSDRHRRLPAITSREFRLAGRIGEPNVAVAGPNAPPPPQHASWGRAIRCAPQATCRGWQNGVVRAIGTERCEYGSNMACRHSRTVFAFAPRARQPRLEPIARAQCATNKYAALVLARAPSLESCAVPPRRRGAAVRQHGERGHALPSR